MRPGDILGRIFFMLSQKSIIGSSGFIHGAHGGHGSSDCFRYAMSRIKLALIMPWRENKGVANLDGIYTDFIELLRKKSLGEIFFKMLLRKKYIQLPGN